MLSHLGPSRPHAARVPHGITLICRLFDEGTIARAGLALERAFNVAADAETPPTSRRRKFFMGKHKRRERGQPPARLCGYCGKETTQLTVDHVVPKSLYSLSSRRSKLQLLTIPACEPCNHSFSDAEAQFRLVMATAGEPNPAVRELWDEEIIRTFEDKDGDRRIRDLFQIMEPLTLDGEPRRVIFPAHDEKVLFVVRKIVRGLAYFHQLAPYIEHHRVIARIEEYLMPSDWSDKLVFHHRGPGIMQYSYALLSGEGNHSIWRLTFFERTTFVAIIS